MSAPDESVTIPRALFDEMRERIRSEDWQGTCGDCGYRRRCTCKAEHDALMKRIDDAADFVRRARESGDSAGTPAADSGAGVTT